MPENTKFMTPSEMLAEPLIWRTLIARLPGNPAGDATVIAGFCEATKIHPRDVLAKMRTHLHPSNGGLN